jgi:hypothetical protein
MARPSSHSPFGKLDAELKVAIDEGTREALTALAFLASKPMSEYIRDLLHVHVHGHAAVAKARMAGQE